MEVEVEVDSGWTLRETFNLGKKAKNKLQLKFINMKILEPEFKILPVLMYQLHRKKFESSLMYEKQGLEQELQEAKQCDQDDDPDDSHVFRILHTRVLCHSLVAMRQRQRRVTDI